MRNKKTQERRNLRLLIAFLVSASVVGVLWHGIALSMRAYQKYSDVEVAQKQSSLVDSLTTDDSSDCLGTDYQLDLNPIAPGDLFIDESGRIASNGSVIIHHGIDVSSHQKQIDWNAVKNDGIEFAIIRVGYRGYSEGVIHEDEYFRQNVEGASAAGIKVGIYFFSQAITRTEAIQEAQFVIDSISDCQIDLPVMYDWEPIDAESRTDETESETISGCAESFCFAIEQNGYNAGVYFNLEQGYHVFDVEKLNDYEFWLAEYSEVPSYTYAVDFWQYTCEGNVEGIDGAVDLTLQIIR